jgi:hypothetical protein
MAVTRPEPDAVDGVQADDATAERWRRRLAEVTEAQG